jgi:protein-L-isoaspartate(D-aspartate) O-methyltransferase
MDLERARFNMVEQQIRTWEVLDQDVLDLLYVVRREEFVPPAYRALAFSDLEIPLTANAAGERMWQPKLEARVLQELAPKRSDRVLEIGTGSGYMAALMAARCASVTSIEINPALAATAQANLQRAGIANVAVETGDAAQGWPRHAPYDIILVTASSPILPSSWMEQLKPAGRLFAVIGDAPVMAARLVTRLAGELVDSIDLFETSLAPLANAPQPKRFVF